MQQIDLIVLGVLVLFLLVMPFVIKGCLADLYRHKEGSGGKSGVMAGMMLEMDRIVNPAGTHVTEAKEVETREDEVGGD
ncbi:MAG: hypothetical protein P1V19_11985 [Gimesia sp.]|nr:hypothetical protein [Gimesia sp.]